MLAERKAPHKDEGLGSGISHKITRDCDTRDPLARCTRSFTSNTKKKKKKIGITQADIYLDR